MECAKKTLLEEIATILEFVISLIRSGHCDNMDLDFLEGIKNTTAKMLDVKVDYKAATKITGKSYSALQSAVSRNGTKTEKVSQFKFSDLLAITKNNPKNMH